MSSSLPATRPPLQDNEGVLPLLGAVPSTQPTHNGDVDPLWLLGCVSRALRRTMSHKAAALTLEIDKGNLTRLLNGEGRLDVRQLGRLGQDWAEALIDEVKAFYRLDDHDDQIARVAERAFDDLRFLAEEARRAKR